MNQQTSQPKTDLSGPLDAPLQLQLSFPSSPQRAATFSSQLVLRNKSKSTVYIYNDLNIGVVISAEVRTINGVFINIWKDITGQIPIAIDGSDGLPPNRSIKTDNEWPSFYKKIEESMGDVRIQFKYDTAIVDPPLANYKPPVQRSYVYSKPVVLRVKDNMIYVLGDYHKIYPYIRRNYIRYGIKLIKTDNNQTDKYAMPILEVIADDRSVKRVISTPYDLENLVHIKNNEDALDFVRLFTARDTHFLFREINFLEVQREPDARTNGLGVDMQWYWWENFRLNSPVVKKVGNEYLINRYLLTYPDALTKKCKLYLSEENVYTNGKYQHRVAKVTAESAFTSNPDIRLPYY